MKVGMLWFDEDPTRSLDARIDRAADYYQRKYGARPNLCMVHPQTMAQESRGGQGELTVRSSKSVLPNYFWLGVDERNLQSSKR
jgi:hypothetical protein